MRKVTWRGKVGMWLLEKDLVMSYWVWRNWVFLWDRYQEVRQRDAYYTPGLWP